MATTNKETPMMEQFRKIKETYPDALLLFRCGDFYETYADDAVLAAKILNITLTKRNNGQKNADMAMAGFPYHALDTYLPKLVRAGQRVAICDQLEDPKAAKKLVKRGVTELVTPGVSYSDTTLTAKENNFVACLFADKKNNNDNKKRSNNKTIGIAFLDISTGEFLVAEGATEHIDKLLTNLAPKEVLFLRGQKQWFESLFGNKYFTFELEDWMLTLDAAQDRLTRQFGTNSLKGFGVEHLTQGVIAAGGIMHYLDATQHLQTNHIRSINRIDENRYVWLDSFTVRNLELTNGLTENSKSLLQILDDTRTPMGGRLLRRWINSPLKSVNSINNRQSVVDFFFTHQQEREQTLHMLMGIQDLERIVGKISTLRIGPRDMIQLAQSLGIIEKIKLLCDQATDNHFLQQMLLEIDPCTDMRRRIEKTIIPTPPMAQGKIGTIARGVDSELDELRDIQSNSRDYLMQMQQRESETTGIQGLKIGFNNVFGYYLEVRNAYKELVPQEWIRKQTLVGSERYITQELKEYEEKILSADEKMLIIETRLYNELVLSLQDYVSRLQTNASIIAQIDCLLSFASVAVNNHYTRPEINDSLTIDITQGRHPVIEQLLPIGQQYVANDIMLDNNSQQIMIITGPNMAGKSALLRQTALIVLMAQIGSFVPADQAKIGVVDKIFTRVGANDNISMGESTFMVEMNEAASILNNMSERSLILFDELGRGTSTYDGISIAWAIVEHIHNSRFRTKTLFATHYHELNEMERSFERIHNYNVSVKEANGKIVFLRRLVKGGSEHSFGIHVAALVGMPTSIVKRAEQILKELEKNNSNNNTSTALSSTASNGKNKEGIQLSIFQLDDPVLKQIKDEVKNLDLNSLTPLQALNKLSEIQKLL